MKNDKELERFNRILKKIVAVLVEEGCTVAESKNHLRNASIVIERSPTVQYIEQT